MTTPFISPHRLYVPDAWRIIPLNSLINHTVPIGTQSYSWWMDGYSPNYGYNMQYPLVSCYSLLLNMAIEIVDFPINSMVIFHSYVNVYQMVASRLSHIYLGYKPNEFLYLISTSYIPTRRQCLKLLAREFVSSPFFAFRGIMIETLFGHELA